MRLDHSGRKFFALDSPENPIEEYSFRLNNVIL
jgi:hypothetical protein